MMINWIPILAAKPHPLEGLRPDSHSNPAMRLLFGDLQMLLLAVLTLTLALVLVTYAIKKKKNPRAKKIKVKKMEDLDPSTEVIETSEHAGRRKIKYRRRRRAHRSRNPTLADTGGLPPPKNNLHSG